MPPRVHPLAVALCVAAALGTTECKRSSPGGAKPIGASAASAAPAVSAVPSAFVDERDAMAAVIAAAMAPSSADAATGEGAGETELRNASNLSLPFTLGDAGAGKVTASPHPG